MLVKTHLLITLLFILILFPFMNYPILFLIIAIIATYIPDIDSRFSKTGNHFYLRPIQWFIGHRGFVHSFTFLILVTFGFVLFIPIIAFPFFLGYCSHLLADSLTIYGTRPFYPSNWKCSGSIRTGGFLEKVIFLVLVVVNSCLFVSVFFNMLF
jgi:membrane-bound metal-dependent hydrolase YbcI (DUF457 family)